MAGPEPGEGRGKRQRFGNDLWEEKNVDITFNMRYCRQDENMMQTMNFRAELDGMWKFFTVPPICSLQ